MRARHPAVTAVERRRGAGRPLLPDTERAAHQNELADVVGGVIRDEQDREEISLSGLSGWNLCGQIRFTSKPFQCLTRARREAVSPRFGVGRGGIQRPVVIRPLEAVFVVRVDAEIEEVSRLNEI